MAVLEEQLNGYPGSTRYQVLNFGVPGYNTFQVYRNLTRRVDSYNPDLVLMTISSDDVETTPVVIKVDGDWCVFWNQFEGTGLLNNSLHWSANRWSALYRFLYGRLVLALLPEASLKSNRSHPGQQ